MSTDATFGTILSGPTERDAIHVATAAVVAVEPLRPSMDIGFVTDGDIYRVGSTKLAKKTIGIVDPYLKRAVLVGEWFWMFLYPRTITSLHHNWTHPDFALGEESTADDLIGTISAMRDGSRLPKIPIDHAVRESRQWLEDFAAREDIDSYETLMDAARGYIESRDYLCDGDKWEGSYVHDEFWDHYEKVTKQAVARNDRGSFFSCSC